MRAGYIKLRRGILDHVPGRISMDEAGAYTWILLMADHRNGIWLGSSQALAAQTGWSTRKAQRILKALRDKGYTSGECRNGVGSYPIRVSKYFKDATPVAHLPERCDTTGASWAKDATPVATLQEVIQEEKIQEGAQGRRASPKPPFRPKVKTTGKDLEGIVDIATSGKGARKDYLEFLDLRDRKQLPKGMTWAKWERLTPEERKAVLSKVA